MVGEGMRIVTVGKYLKPMSTKDIPTRPSVIVVNRQYITPSPPPEVEQSMAKHRGEDIAQEILDEIMIVVGKKVKSTPDEIQRVGGGVEVEKSVGRGGKKVNKKVGVVGGENIV